jgi:hypothetical protein
MKTGDIGKLAATVAAVSAGVILAGYIMSQFRSTVGFIGTAHSGFDS